MLVKIEKESRVRYESTCRWCKWKSGETFSQNLKDYPKLQEKAVIRKEEQQEFLTN